MTRENNNSAENDQNGLRRSVRKRVPTVSKMALLKHLFTSNQKKNPRPSTTSKAKSTSKPRYKRIREQSSDTDDNGPNRFANDENRSTNANVKILPKRLKLTMTPERSLRAQINNPTIINPLETPEFRIPISTQYKQPTILMQTQTVQTPKTSKTPQPPQTQLSPVQSSSTPQIVVKKPESSNAIWVNDSVYTSPLTSSSSLIVFQGESADYFWQSPIALNFVILHGKFKCEKYAAQLTCGYEINVPAGEGIQITLSKESKEGRILCFAR